MGGNLLKTPGCAWKAIKHYLHDSTTTRMASQREARAGSSSKSIYLISADWVECAPPSRVAATTGKKNYTKYLNVKLLLPILMLLCIHSRNNRFVNLRKKDPFFSLRCVSCSIISKCPFQKLLSVSQRFSFPTHEFWIGFQWNPMEIAQETERALFLFRSVAIPFLVEELNNTFLISLSSRTPQDKVRILA